MEIQSLYKLSVAAKLGIIVGFGICVYALCCSAGFKMTWGDYVISFLTCLLFGPLIDITRPLKIVGLVCLVGLLICVSAWAFGFERGFRDGFSQRWNHGHTTQAINR
jgi:hypothetical protein